MPTYTIETITIESPRRLNAADRAEIEEWIKKHPQWPRTAAKAALLTVLERKAGLTKTEEVQP